MNSVRLYSNGTAIISRDYSFAGGAPLRIAIPVRKSDLDDVVSSLAVFGDVAIAEPPTYTPTNAERPTLTIEPANALRDLATKLAGAAVVVEAGPSYQGTLIGLHSFRREVAQTFVQVYRWILLTERGIQQVDEDAVTALRFTDAAIQAEIDKALRARLEEIKPDSSRVELTVQPNPGASAATLVYATPVAAWKIRYQLRLDAGGAELDGQAIVDNDTDDDWTDAEITVVTGEPITFSTDLAEVRRPSRSRVNVIADEATGAVVAEAEMMPVAAAAAPPDYDRGGRGGYGGGSGNISAGARMRRAAIAAAPAAAAPGAGLARAEQVEAETHASGDFSLFTSPDRVSIGAGRSALIPLFRTNMGDPRTILLYRERDDHQRPFRAVRFRNQADHALGRGVCEVFDKGEFQGKCLLEPTKPGGEALLVHAKETGVRVVKKSDRPESRRLAVRIAAGVIVEETLRRQRTTYHAQNSHAAEGFTLEVEHPRTLPDARMLVTLSAGEPVVAEIPSGRRIGGPLPAGSALEVRVVEEQVESKQFLVSASWLAGNLVGLKAPQAEEPGLQRCIDLQGRIDALNAQIVAQAEAAATLGEEQERLIKLIPNAHAEQANAWRSDLADAERELRLVKRTNLPQLREQLKEAQNALHQALADLQYRWSEADADIGSTTRS